MEKIKLLKEVEFRNNENGFFSITTPYGDMIINEMGKFIIENINNNDFSQLCVLVKHNYSLDAVEAKKRVENYLYELRNVGLIKFFDEMNDFYSNDHLQIAGEKEYKNISNDIIKCFGSNNTIYSISTDKKYFNIYSVRTRSFSNHENYFYCCRDGQYTIIGIKNLDTPKTPVFISLLKYGNDLEDLSILFDELLLELLKLEQFKIRITLNSSINNNVVENFIINKGFGIEGVLEKEDGVNDYKLYGKILMKENI